MDREGGRRREREREKERERERERESLAHVRTLKCKSRSVGMQVTMDGGETNDENCHPIKEPSRRRVIWIWMTADTLYTRRSRAHRAKKIQSQARAVSRLRAVFSSFHSPPALVLFIIIWMRWRWHLASRGSHASCSVNRAGSLHRVASGVTPIRHNLCSFAMRFCSALLCCTPRHAPPVLRK
ncbi:hypothetical protein F4803DRAFT_512833 [Xylaria telfairii]|nr:hypothetical protein F4803DRAFT_512833 [Xylaria telfairii]